MDIKISGFPVSARRNGNCEPCPRRYAQMYIMCRQKGEIYLASRDFIRRKLGLTAFLKFLQWNLFQSNTFPCSETVSRHFFRASDRKGERGKNESIPSTSITFN